MVFIFLKDQYSGLEGCILKRRESEYFANWILTKQGLGGGEEDCYSLIGNMRVKYICEGVYSHRTYLVISVFLL